MNRPTFGRFFLTFAACSFCVAIGIPQLVVAQDKHPFTWEDSSVLHRATPLSVSPDGKTILYVVSYEGDKGPTKHEWRLVESDLKMDAGNITLRTALVDYRRCRDVGLFACNSSAR